MLTDTGLEVEGLEEIQVVPGGLAGLVIGQVKEKRPHPAADRLQLTRVDTGSGKDLQIVCGAPNVDKGQKVVVAPVGTTLYPAGGQPFKIKKARIRGEESFGMICAEDEIGLGDSHDGIMVLPDDAPLGQPVSVYFNLQGDWVFEIGLTPNRADAASHIGVARDLAAVLKKKVNYPSVADFAPDRTTEGIPVEVEDPAACPRYSGLVIKGVRVGDSPDWLKRRLQAIGVKPINNVVDITNFVLHETGQPLHAFDLDEIGGGKIAVRTLAEGTPFTTLDGVERRLSGEDLMICDASKGLCIAGVFGGIGSGIRDSTANIFLESACFSPVSVRKTAKYHGLKTDASFRFERGTDPNLTVYALKRAAILIREVAGGEVVSDVSDHYPEPVKPVEVDLSYEYAARLIGKNIPASEIRSLLEHLEIDILESTESGLKLAVPTARVDVTRQVDVVEEILRIYGYNRVEIPAKVNASLARSGKPDPEAIRHAVAGFLSSNGFAEIMTNSLSSAAYTALIPGLKEAENVKILNPLSSELDTMRQSMLPGGLGSVAYNLNRKSADLKFYEFGKVYRSAGQSYREARKLAVLITGRKQPEQWNSNATEVDFYDLKGYAEAMLSKLDIRVQEWKPVQEGDLETGLAGYAATTGDRKAPQSPNHPITQSPNPVVRLGRVSGKILAAFEIEQPVYYAEFDWELILGLRKGHKIRYREVPRYPAVRRDLSLLLDKEITFEQLEQIAYQAEQKILKKVSIFDLYEGEKLPSGKKSYALSFFLQDESGTLQEKQIDRVMQRLIDLYSKKGIAIRK